MAHYLGKFFEYLAAFLVFIFSITLGYTFFASIAPPNMAWFIPAAMGLTEAGLLCWLAVFMLEKHHDAKKTVALVMVFACLLAVLVIDGVELAKLLGQQLIITQYVFIVLVFMFALHMLAFIGNFFIGYFSIHSFTGEPGNLIPKQFPSTRELNSARGAQAQPNVQIKEISDRLDAITGYLVAARKEGAETDDPLAQRQLPRPKQKREAAVEPEEEQAAPRPVQPLPRPEEKKVTLLHAFGILISAGASSLMRRAKDSIASGRQVAPVPGDQSEITKENTLLEEEMEPEDES